MTINLTNKEAVALLNGIITVEGMNISVPAIVGYRMLQNKKKLVFALDAYEDMRMGMVFKHSHGKSSISREEDPEAYDACVAEINELDNLPVEVDIVKVSIETLKDRDLPMAVISALDFMLE